jgi:heme exporter protein D
MTIGNWVTVVVALAGVVTTLVVAYLQRRQMRQIEAYRQDPSVGLVPPPHPLRQLLWRFLRRFWAPIWYFGWGGFEFRHLFRQGLTGDFMFHFSLGLGSTVIGLVLLLFDAVRERIRQDEEFTEKILHRVRQGEETTDEIIRVLRKLTGAE